MHSFYISHLILLLSFITEAHVVADVSVKNILDADICCSLISNVGYLATDISSQIVFYDGYFVLRIVLSVGYFVAHILPVDNNGRYQIII